MGRDLRLKVVRTKPQALWTEIWEDPLRVAHSVLGDKSPAQQRAPERSHRPGSPSWAEDMPQGASLEGKDWGWGSLRVLVNKQTAGEKFCPVTKSGRRTAAQPWLSGIRKPGQRETKKCRRSMAHPVGPSSQAQLSPQAHPGFSRKPGSCPLHLCPAG